MPVIYPRRMGMPTVIAQHIAPRPSELPSTNSGVVAVPGTSDLNSAADHSNVEALVNFDFNSALADQETDAPNALRRVVHRHEPSPIINDERVVR